MNKFFLSLFLVHTILFSYTFGNVSATFQQSLTLHNTNNLTDALCIICIKDYSSLLVPFLFVPLDETIRDRVPKLELLKSLSSLEFEHFLILAASTSLITSYYNVSVARTITQSFVTTSVITGLVKFIVGRARPYVNIGALAFSPFSISKTFQSFPSGHASLSWAIFTPIAQNFGFHWYFIPVIFSVQRLWSDEHWLSDIIFGSVLGWQVANRTREEK